jgi:hypothetical protein
MQLFNRKKRALARGKADDGKPLSIMTIYQNEEQQAELKARFQTLGFAGDRGTKGDWANRAMLETFYHGSNIGGCTRSAASTERRSGNHADLLTERKVTDLGGEEATVDGVRLSRLSKVPEYISLEVCPDLSCSSPLSPKSPSRG